MIRLARLFLACVMVLAACLAAQGQSLSEPDLLNQKGCHPAEEAKRFIDGHKGQTALSLQGVASFDAGKDIEADEGKNEYRYDLIFYNYGKMREWSLLRSRDPKEPGEKRCVLAAGSKGEIVDPRNQASQLEPGWKFEDKEKSLKGCKPIRDPLRNAYDMGLTRFGGKVITRRQEMFFLSDMLGTDPLQRELREVIDDEKAAKQGDNLCKPYIDWLSDDKCKMFANLLGNEYLASDGLDMVFSFRQCTGDAWPWQVLASLDSGATFEWGRGKSYEPTAEYFGALTTALPSELSKPQAPTYEQSVAPREPVKPEDLRVIINASLAEHWDNPLQCSLMGAPVNLTRSRLILTGPELQTLQSDVEVRNSGSGSTQSSHLSVVLGDLDFPATRSLLVGSCWAVRLQCRSNERCVTEIGGTASREAEIFAIGEAEANQLADAVRNIGRR